jgi:hypothetical protein
MKKIRKQSGFEDIKIYLFGGKVFITGATKTFWFTENALASRAAMLNKCICCL